MVVKDELFKYLKSPDRKLFIFDSLLQKQGAFMRAFGLCLLIVFVLSIFTAAIRIFGHIEFQPNDIPLVYFWAINILVIPLFEETTFRLPLIYSRGSLSLSGLFISYIIISYITGYSPIDAEGMAFRFCISVILAITLFLVLGRKYFVRNVPLLWDNNGKLIFLLLLFAFTLRHLDNYVLTSTVLLFFPILLLPQLVNGIFFSFVRVRFGFVYSILFHTMINTAAFLPQMILHYANR